MIPLLVLALWRLLSRKSLRRPVVMFQLFLVAGFAMAIAGTSLETRHFGDFLPSLFILALVPDLSQKIDKKAYQTLLMLFVVLLAVMHSAWLIIKI
jgi:hypothetical protein